MRRIVHWDGDSFFASIEQAADRRLRQRPVAVGGERRGVVLSASLEARRFGIRPGMPMNKARRACPRLVTMPAHFDLYDQFSDQILLLCEQRTPLVETPGAGAAWLDLTGTEAYNGSAIAYAQDLRREVHSWLRVPISCAVAANKTVARIAARWRKPHAPIEIPHGQEATFLSPLPLAWLPGLGPHHVDTLEVAGLRRIGELARAPIDSLEAILGRQSLKLQRRAQGLDETPVGAPSRAAADPTFRESLEFPEDVWDTPRILQTLRSLLEDLMPRVRAQSLEVRRLTLTLRYTDREESERSVTLPEPTAVEDDFYPRLGPLLAETWERRVRLRAVSLKLSRPYVPSPQMSLFDVRPPAAKSEAEKEKALRLATAVDRIRGAFGTSALKRGLSGILSES